MSDPYRSLPTLTICVKCAHSQGRLACARFEYECVGGERIVTSPRRIDYVTGVEYPALYKYVSCAVKNSDGQCLDFEPIPPSAGDPPAQLDKETWLARFLSGLRRWWLS